MIQYIQLFFGFILGQSLMMAMNVYTYQKDMYIEYKQAVKAYAKAEVGYFIIAGIGLLVMLFVMSDFLDLTISKEDLKQLDVLNLKQKLQLYFKTGSVLLGMFIQFIAFKVRKTGKEAIDNAVIKP